MKIRLGSIFALRVVRPHPIPLAMLLLSVAIALPAPGRAEVEPGDVITYADRERVRELFPPELWALVVADFEGLELSIVESGDYTPHAKYVEATTRYACQAEIDEHDQLVSYVAGQPFPFSDWARDATEHACDFDPEDPQIGLKLAWNVNYRWMGGGTLHYPHWGQSYARADGGKSWKLAQGSYRRTYFSHRSDLLPATTRILPDTDVEWAERTSFESPFDVRDQASVIFRYDRSYERRDDAWAYMPQQRRVRRLSTGEKSDSVLGSEITYEDFFLFSGYVWDQEWRYGGERWMLVPIDTQRACFPKSIPGWRPDRFGPLGDQTQFDSCRFGPFETLPLVDERWQKRRVVRLEQIPKRADHPYSKKLLWYDKQTLAPLVYLAYGRDGKPNRVGWYISDWTETSDVAGNPGSRALLPVAYLLVNFAEGTTNRSLFFTANVIEVSGEEALRFFDLSRMQKGH